MTGKAENGLLVDQAHTSSDIASPVPLEEKMN
jgi:hypothetical protein